MSRRQRWSTLSRTRRAGLNSVKRVEGAGILDVSRKPRQFNPWVERTAGALLASALAVVRIVRDEVVGTVPVAAYCAGHHEALFLEPGYCGPGGVRLPACGVLDLGGGGALRPAKQADQQRLLGVRAERRRCAGAGVQSKFRMFAPSRGVAGSGG